MTAYTIEQLVKSFKDFADSHVAIESFNCTLHTPASMDIKYPLMQVSIGDATLTTGKDMQKFYIFFVGRLNEGETNYIRLMSDMKSLATDFYAYFMNFQNFARTFRIDDEELPLTQITLQDNDKTAGWQIELNISMGLATDCNDIPLI